MKIRYHINKNKAKELIKILEETIKITKDNFIVEFEAKKIKYEDEILNIIS